MFDDENFQDGFDDEALARGMNFSLWKKLFRYARRYPIELRWLGFYAVLTALMEVAYPLITKSVFDEYALNGQAASYQNQILAYALCTGLIVFAIGGFIWMAGKIRTHISHDIRADGFDNLQRLSFSFFDYRPVGWLMARMTSDCERLSNILAWGFLDLVWGFTMMIGIAIAMMVMNLQLALIVLAILPFLAWVSARFQRRILGSARKVRATNSRITGAYNEAIMGVLTSKAFVREDQNQREFTQLTNTMYRASVLNLSQAAVYVPIVITLASLATGIALAMGGFDLLGGLMEVGTLVAFMAYTRHFFDPIEQLGHWFAEMQMAQASAERILSLIEADPEIQDSHTVRNKLTRPQTPTPGQAIDGGESLIEKIELRNLGFAYLNGQPVLKNINLTVHRGQSVAIVGPTGGGKSTLVNIICRFYEPTSGEVLINGIDYRHRSLAWLQSNLGMVLQNAHIFSGSIIDNIRYGNLQATEEELISASKLAGAHNFILHMSHGYETQVGESGSQLSAGQKQLISFARAVIADSQILIMDEATSSIDTETEAQIQRGIENLMGDRLSIIIAHRLSTIRNADRIVVIADGQIIEHGSHHSLMASEGHYFDLYRQQSLQQSQP